MVSPDSGIDVVDIIDDVVDDTVVDGVVDVDGVADVPICSLTVDSVVALSFPLAKNFVGISNILDCCISLFLSLLKPFRAARMSARPRLFSETNPSPSLYL